MSPEQETSSPDRRTVLAADRTVLAAERTYAAWLRTGLTALAAGVGAKAALGQALGEFFVLIVGSALCLMSALCFVAAVWRELSPGAPPPNPDVPRLPPHVLVVVSGFLVLVSLSALVGIWVARTPGL